MSDTELMRNRAAQAVQDILATPGDAATNLTDFATRVAMRVQELVEGGWKPKHPDILKARELFAKMVSANATWDSRTIDTDERMRFLLAGIDLGRELQEELHDFN